VFGKHWTAAQGTIVDRKGSWTGDGMVADYDFVVDVTTPTGEVFRAKVETPRIAIDFRDPSIGAVVRVEFDDESRKVRFDKDDPQLSMKAFRKSQESSFDASLNAPVGSPPPGRSPAAGAPIVGALSMEQLQAMLNAQAGTGGPQVIRLDSSDPAAAATKEALLKALGLSADGTPPEQAAPEE
jgi:hypothetical protein